MPLRFRLARVLRLRTQLRERTQEELAEARAKLTALRERLAAARAERLETRRAEDAAMCRGVTGAELTTFRAWDAAQATREEALAAESVRLTEAVTERREAVVARRREERQLERLRERAAERHEVENERVEAALLDELARRAREERR